MTRSGVWRTVSDPRFAWGLWVVYAAAAAAVRLSHPPDLGVVYYCYLSGGMNFLAGVDLYDGTGNNFVYLPTAALPFLPLSFLPYVVGGALWRMTNLLVFGWGALRLARTSDGPRGTLLIVSVVTMALSWSAGRHGQMTLIMAGCMLLAVADLQAARWWRASLFMALSFALKQLSLPLLLVAAVLYKPLRARLVSCVALVFLTPFLFQLPDYVASQYAGVPDMMTALAERNSANRTVFVHLFSLLETCGLSLGDTAQMIARGLFALLTLGACWVAKRKSSRELLGFYLYTFVICYALLFNPVAERNTYAIMAPVLGLGAALATLGGHKRAAIALWSIVPLFAISHTLTVEFPGTPLSMMKPIGCVLLAGLAGWHLLATTRADPGSEEASALS